MTIVRVRGGYKVRTSSGKLVGRKGGRPYRTRAAALKRERQMVFFRNLKKSSGNLRRKVRRKSLLKRVR